MFKNDYQGGNFFEIFSAQGKDPAGQWKLQGGSGIRRIYEKEVKSFVYNLEGTVATTKMQIPKDLKQSLSLVQRYLIFQLNVPIGGEFSLEIGVTDIGNNKRRLNLSTSAKEISATPLHAKLPLTVLRKSVWVNCCCDMVNIVGETWPGQTFGKVDSLSISANCKLRRILTMRLQPPDTTDDDSIYGPSESVPIGGTDSIPRQHQLATDVYHVTQLLNLHKVRSAEVKVKGDRPSPIDLDLSASGRRMMNESFHIAFGTKIGKPPTAGVGRKSTSSGLPSHRENLRASAGVTARESYDPSTRPTARTHRHAHADRMMLPHSINGRQRLLSDPGKLVEINHRSNNPLGESKSWSGSDMQEQKLHEAAFTMPHPPARDSSAESTGRRKPKVRSGERQYRTPADAHLSPATNSNSTGHHHTVSAPSIPQHMHNYPPGEQREDNPSNSKLSPLKQSKLSPLDRKTQLPHQSAHEPRQHFNKNSLQPLDQQQEHKAGINNYNTYAVPAVVWTSQTEAGRVPQANVAPWYQHDLSNGVGEESVTDVIAAVRNKMGLQDRADDSEDEDKRNLIDSLENFIKSDGRSSSEEEDRAAPTLFHFRAPPKAAVNSLNKKPAADSSILNSKRSPTVYNNDEVEARPPLKPSPPQKKADRPTDLPIYSNGAVYSPSAYKSRSEDDSAEQISGAKLIKRSEVMVPHPPGSPKISSRPGSGRLRSRHGSRASNHSNKPTPDSSSNGEELGKALGFRTSNLVKGDSELALNNNDIMYTPDGQYVPNGGKWEEPSPDSPGSGDAHNFNKQVPAKRILRHGDDLEGLPSPRTSEREPRISSAGRRGGSANSRQSELSSGSSDSTKENRLVPPLVHMLRSSDRGGSPVNSSRESTRVSRKSVREILVNAPHSANSPTMGYEPSTYQHFNETFDEAKMLQTLKREQEVGGSIDEQNNLKRPVAVSPHQYEHKVSDDEHSSDESYMTISVPIAGSHDYKDEMKDTLEMTDTRDLGMFSPPIVIASQSRSEEDFTTSNFSLSPKKGKKQKRLSGSSGVGMSGGASGLSPGIEGTDYEQEEELDLIFDHVLNCYYDPRTHKYYELV